MILLKVCVHTFMPSDKLCSFDLFILCVCVLGMSKNSS